MPLIMMCGIPSSGKTTLANRLELFLKEKGFTVHIVNEESLKIDRNEAYGSSLAEKKARGNIKAAVERLLTKNAVTICDSLNYIKGFRYELFTRARAIQTPTCVVYCNVNIETCRLWNKERLEGKYSDSCFEDMASRMEVPNENVKWDKPVFIYDNLSDFPFEPIHEALLSAPAAPTLATISTPLLSTSFLFDLDRLVQGVEQNILQEKPVMVNDKPCKIQLVRKTTIAELKRIRAKFLTFCKQKPPVGTEADTVEMYMLYIKNNMEL